MIFTLFLTLNLTYNFLITLMKIEILKYLLQKKKKKIIILHVSVCVLAFTLHTQHAGAVKWTNLIKRHIRPRTLLFHALSCCWSRDVQRGLCLTFHSRYLYTRLHTCCQTRRFFFLTQDDSTRCVTSVCSSVCQVKFIIILFFYGAIPYQGQIYQVGKKVVIRRALTKLYRHSTNTGKLHIYS